jgi:hypothetical protein
LGEYYGGSIGLLHASFEASLSLLGRQQLMTSHLARAGGTEAIDKYQLIAITGNHHFAIEKCVYIYIHIYIYLVGGIPTPLKNMKVKCDDYSQYIYI